MGGPVAMQALLQGTPTPFGSKSRIARVWVAAADRLEGMRGWGRESVKTSELSALMQSMPRSSEATCVNITRIYASVIRSYILMCVDESFSGRCLCVYKIFVIIDDLIRGP